MGSEGNEYDFNPPSEPTHGGGKAGSGGGRSQECKNALLSMLSSGPKPVQEARSELEKEKFGSREIYQAKAGLGVSEYMVGNRKWWELPSESAA